MTTVHCIVGWVQLYLIACNLGETVEENQLLCKRFEDFQQDRLKSEPRVLRVEEQVLLHEVINNATTNTLLGSCPCQQ